MRQTENGFIKPSMVHHLGTNYLGRDVLSRMIYGSHTSLIVSTVAIGLGAAVGMTLGLISPFFGGKVYATIMRFIDTFMALAHGNLLYAGKDIKGPATWGGASGG